MVAIQTDLQKRKNAFLFNTNKQEEKKTSESLNMFDSPLTTVQ